MSLFFVANRDNVVLTHNDTLDKNTKSLYTVSVLFGLYSINGWKSIVIMCFYLSMFTKFFVTYKLDATFCHSDAQQWL